MRETDIHLKRNRRLAIVLVFLCTAITVLLWLGRDSNSFSVDQSLYRYADLVSVSRVLLENPSGGNTDLVNQGARWKVNGAFNADRAMVDVLFATLQQAEPKRPVAASMRDSVLRQLNTNGVRVSLYTGEKKVKTFIAGGDPSRSQAWFVAPGEDEPHVMVIPGYRVYVSGIFEVPAYGWRDKIVFDINWRNFKSLQVRFRNPRGDFSVGLNGNVAFIESLPSADTSKLNTFLDQLSMLSVEEHLKDSPVPDSGAAVSPFATFFLSDIGGRTWTLEVVEFQGNFYGRINQEVWAVLDRRKVRQLLLPKEFFAKQ